MRINPTITKRFFNLIEKTSDCWLWKGYRNKPRPYGRFTINGKDEIASRVSWEIHHGPIPEGMHVLHRCDNPPCVNPEHLFIGTQKENVQDCAVKNRRRVKLKPEDVRWIRANNKKIPQSEIAKRFGVSRNAIYCVQSFKSWEHLE